MSAEVPTTDEFIALMARVDELEQRLAAAVRPPENPYLTVLEAADLLRCRRQRIDDLLSQGRLTRYKDGSRTLLSRGQLEEHLRTRGQ